MKAALEHVTRVWAAALGPAGVRVNAVAAGTVLTPPLAGLPEPVRDALDKARGGLHALGGPVLGSVSSGAN